MFDKVVRYSFVCLPAAFAIVRADGVGRRIAASMNDKLKAIIDGARQEGQLSIVVGEGTIGGSDSGFAAGFNKYYGLNLDVRFTPGPPMPNMVGRDRAAISGASRPRSPTCSSAMPIT